MPKALLLEIARMPFPEQLAIWPEVKSGGVTVRSMRAVRRSKTASTPKDDALSSTVRGWERLIRALEVTSALLRAGDGFDPAIEQERLSTLRDRLQDCLSVVDALLIEEK